MSTTQRARAVPNAQHGHFFDPVPDAGTLTTTMLATSIYAGTGTVAGATPDDSANGGTATTISRGDHRHAAPCATAVALTQTSSSTEGNSNSFARANHTHATDALPWGFVAAPFDATASDGPHSATTTTDMVLNNVPVIIDHWYALHIHTQLTLSGTGVWVLDLLVNGVAVDRMWRVDQVDPTPTADATVYWKAPATAATDDFAVRATEASGTATLTLTGSAAVHRWLTITDKGIAP